MDTVTPTSARCRSRWCMACRAACAPTTAPGKGRRSLRLSTISSRRLPVECSAHLPGALSGRKIPFDRNQFAATVDGRIVGVGRTIRIESIAVHYDLVAPIEHREAIERAL